MGSLLIVAILSVSLMRKSLCAEESGKSRIISYENENSVPGKYKFKYETSDGTFREETGELTNDDHNNVFIVIRGSYSYVSSDGRRYTVRYIADDKGFRPEISRPTDGTSQNSKILVRIGGDAVSSLQGGGFG